MNFKFNEALLMAYLYGELQGEEKRAVEEYLALNPQVKKELEELAGVRRAMSRLTDKEVIAPPIVLEGNQRFFWHTPYIRTVLGIAASVLILIMAGWVTGLQVNYASQELSIAFGASRKNDKPVETLTSDQVQHMINESLQQNNVAIETGWQQTQAKIDESIRKHMANRPTPNTDALVQQAANATQEQVRQYILNMQTENAKLMKDYMTLTSQEQSQYIGELLVDFGKYLEQQRQNDFQTLQIRLSSIEQNTNLFKQETEQILTSIISSVEGTSKEIKN